MLSIKKLTIAFTLAIYSLNCASQTIDSVTIASPNVASFNKFATIPHGNYTGIINTSIPIYTIQEGDITLPITLNNAASGIKVSENASWCGLGWHLDYGGMITREVRGNTDEGLGGWLINNEAMTVAKATNRSGSYVSIPTVKGSDIPSAYLPAIDSIAWANGNTKDGEADVFHFSALNYSGQFFYNRYHNIVQAPFQNINIQGWTPQNTNAEWQITTPEGLVFNYGKNIEIVNNNNGIGSANIRTSFFVDEIDDQNGNKVQFKYKRYSYNLDEVIASQKFFSSTTNNSYGNLQYSNNTVYYTTYQLDTIITSKEVVSFYANYRRTDIPGEAKLDSVIVTRLSDGAVIKRVVFYGSYFNSTSTYDVQNQTTTVPTGNHLLNNTSLRLRLDSVAINGIEKYKFQYNATAIPARGSYDKDVWGYYNAALNGSMLPSIYFAGYAIAPGANIAPNPSAAATGTLSKITYPTGGSSSFSYESNTFVAPANQVLPYLNKITSSSASAYKGAGGPGTVYSSTINYTANSTPLVISFINLSSSSNFQWTVSLVDSATLGTNYRSLVNSSGQSFNLSPGKYKIVLQIISGTSSNFTVAAGAWKSALYTDFTSTAPISAVGGGIRIRQIDNYDPVSNSTITKKFSYNIPGDTTSSGQIVNVPSVFTFDNFFSIIPPGFVPTPSSVQNGDPNYLYCNNINPSGSCVRLRSTSYTPAQPNTSGIVGYSYVTEDDISGAEIHRKIYHFNNVNTNPDFKNAPLTDYPITQYAVQPFNRGLLLDETDYSQINGNFVPVHKDVNRYTTYTTLWDTVNSVRNMVCYLPEWVSGNLYGTYACLVPQTSSNLAHFDTWRVYETISGYHTLDTAYSYIYNQKDTTQVIKSITTYNYQIPLYNSLSLPLLLSRVKKDIDSKGDTVVTNYKYAYDLVGATGNTSAYNAGINNVLSKGFYTFPVEVSSYKNNAGATSSILLKSDFYSYSSTIPKVYQHFTIFNGTQIPGFQPVKVAAQNIQIDPNYQLVHSNDQYTTLGKLAQYHKYVGPNVSCQWGYNNEYPVAQVVNASVGNIFYDSFEEGDGTTAIGGGKSGHYGFNGSTAVYSHGLSGLTPGTYTLSYWEKTGSTWAWVINTAVSVGGTTYTINIPSGRQVDDVRFYPSDAQMTTFTYDPLIGMTSSTDAKGEITYYEYDSFQRLQNIKDKDGNIIKSYVYHYQGQ